MKSKIIGILLLLAGIAGAVVPLLTDCKAHGKVMKNGMPMPCHYSAIALSVIGGIVILLALITIFVRMNIVHYITFILTALAGVAGFLIPNKIIMIGNGVPMKEGGWMCGLCKSPEMPCVSTMMPIMNIVLGVIIALSVIGIILKFVGKEK